MFVPANPTEINTIEAKPGTTTVAPPVLRAGGKLSTRVGGAVEWDGTNLRVTRRAASAPLRSAPTPSPTSTCATTA